VREGATYPIYYKYEKTKTEESILVTSGRGYDSYSTSLDIHYLRP